jgi:hypothetical protein
MEGERDGAALVRPRSAYMFYTMKRRPELKRTDPDLSFGDLIKRMALEWTRMTEEETAPFRAAAEEDKQRYRREKAARGG